MGAIDEPTGEFEIEKLAKTVIVAHTKTLAKQAEIDNALVELLAEMDRQDAEWGEQNLPVVPVEFDARYYAHYHREAEHWRVSNDNRVERGQVAWDGILQEEVAEALAESDPEKHEAELIQVAAVAIQAWLCSRRKRHGGWPVKPTQAGDEAVAA